MVDGRPVVVTGGEDGAVRVWDPTNGRLVGEPRVGRDDQVWAVTTVMIDGRPHAVTGGTRRTRGHWAGQVEIWDLTTHQQVGPQTAFPEPVHAVVVMPDGRLVVHFGREMAVLVRC